MKKVSNNELKQLLSNGIIENIDLTSNDLTIPEFSHNSFKGCILKNVTFSENSSALKLLTNVSFEDGKLIDVCFANSILFKVDFRNSSLENCSFDNNSKVLEPTITKVNFAKVKMSHCRFKNSVITWSDFRYAEIENSTFQGATIDFCDFYRAYFHKINIFKKSQISNSSFNFTLFDGNMFRRENIKSHRILQEQKNKYKKFLEEWKENGPGIRQTDDKKHWEPDNLQDELDEMYQHAENIYRNLIGSWISNGFVIDANWAYIKAKRMERKVLKGMMKREKNVFKKSIYFFKRFTNGFVDFAFGYGESVYKVLRTYVLIILLFTVFLYLFIPLDNVGTSILWSFKNMIAQTPDDIKNSTSFIILLISVIQSTLGVLLTGIFGFI
ncbi:pentapeptide repeat-containing protein, partial [Marinilabilia salmonicolor]